MRLSPLLILEEIFIRSWWVFFFIFSCFFLFEKGIEKHSYTYANLIEQFEELQNEKEKALVLQADFRLRVNSQSDPAWVELVLKKGLGLVPEGETKIFFTEKK